MNELAVLGAGDQANAVIDNIKQPGSGKIADLRRATA